MFWYSMYVKICDFIEFKIWGSLSKYWFEIICGVHVITWWAIIWLVMERACQ